MIAIIDYGAGNLFSVKNALDYLGCTSIITSDKTEIERADSYILPGVGAFPYAMKMLENTQLIDTIKREIQDKPLLGICLGMQMLFEKGHEFEEVNGLQLINGEVIPIPNTGLKIPHMGWSPLTITAPCELLKGVNDGDCVYFVHSFMAQTDDSNIVAKAKYGVDITALTRKNNVYGAQFHPEKSGEVGLKILRNFANL